MRAIRAETFLRRTIGLDDPGALQRQRLGKNRDDAHHYLS